MKNNDQWRARDLDVLWRPCTRMMDHEHLPMIPVRSARGVWLEEIDHLARVAIEGIAIATAAES